MMRRPATLAALATILLPAPGICEQTAVPARAEYRESISRTQIGEHFAGTKGTSDACSRITGARPWTYEKPERPVTGYVQEHTDLVASIRAGRPLNELRQVAESTLTAIMGREAAYTGQEVTWDEMLNADQDLLPRQIAFGPLGVPAVAMPGQTKLSRGWGEA
jgi:myo-inositol 2-dehydrogenase / D-chiro-inositol 1-dehydrogenase